jgi:hypothetical protein
MTVEAQGNLARSFVVAAHSLAIDVEHRAKQVPWLSAHSEQLRALGIVLAREYRLGLSAG